MVLQSSITAFKVLVVDNPQATPGPTWSAMMQQFGRTINPMKDLPVDKSDLPNIQTMRGIAMHHSHGSDKWTIFDATRQILDDVEVSVSICSEIHFILMLVNAADYNPRTYQASARFERDRAIVKRLCTEPWAEGAKLLICLEDVGGMQEKMKEPAPDIFNIEGFIREKSPLTEILDTIIKGFRWIGEVQGGRDIQIHFLQTDPPDVMIEEGLQRLIAFLQTVLLALPRTRIDLGC